MNITGGWLWSCNIFIQRDTFEAVGGFDEVFMYPCMEDVDLRERLVEAGYPFEFVPAAVVDHPPRRMPSGRQLARYQESGVYYWYKHGNQKLVSPRILYNITRSRLSSIQCYQLSGHTLQALGSLASELGWTLVRLPLWEWKYRRQFRSTPSH